MMTITPDTRLLALNYQPRSFGLIITPLPGQARALEGDKLAIEGWVPIVPHDGMLKVRYYKEITDAEFNDFFGNSD